MTDLGARLSAAKQRARYLAELTVLLGRTIEAADLLDLESTKEVIRKSGIAQRVPSWSLEFSFEERERMRFQAFVDRLAVANASDVFLWLPPASVCGLLPAMSLRSIRFDFPFDLIPEGIITIFTEDYSDRLVLDFSEVQGAQLLEVEVQGANWGRVSY